MALEFIRRLVGNKMLTDTSTQGKKAGLSERWLFGGTLLLFGLGMFIRLSRLDAVPFTAAESELAFNALKIARSQGLATGSNPVYLGLTGFLFFLTGAGDALARLLPALAGASIIWLPYFWRKRFGEKQALFLSAAFAFDPLLIIFSRQIITPIFTLAGLLWLLTAIHLKRPALAGLSLALAWLGGYYFWAILLCAGLCLLAARWARKSHSIPLMSASWGKSGWRAFVTALIGGLLLIASAFTLYPAGLSGVGQGLADFIGKFTSPFEIPFGLPIYTTLAYNLGVIILFFVFRSSTEELPDGEWRSLRNLFLAMVVIAALLLSRSETGMTIFLVPFLWKAISSGLTGEPGLRAEERGQVLGLAAFFLVLLVYLSISLPLLVTYAPGSAEFYRVALAGLAGVVLVVLSFVLARLGWTAQIASAAIRLALGMLACVLILSAGLSSLAPAGAERAAYLTQSSPIVFPDRIAADVLQDFTRQGALSPQNDRVEVYGTEIAGSDWVFREFHTQPRLESVYSDDIPQVILSESQDASGLPAAYRGMSLPVSKAVSWPSMRVTDYLRGLTLGTFPIITQQATLWVRADLFTGAE